MKALSENNQNPKTMWNTIRTLTNKNSIHISSTIVNSHCLHQSVKQTDHRQIVPPWGKLYPPGAEPMQFKIALARVISLYLRNTLQQHFDTYKDPRCEKLYLSSYVEKGRYFLDSINTQRFGS